MDQRLRALAGEKSSSNGETHFGRNHMPPPREVGSQDI
jgi:hypothetical protein